MNPETCGSEPGGVGSICLTQKSSGFIAMNSRHRKMEFRRGTLCSQSCRTVPASLGEEPMAEEYTRWTPAENASITSRSQPGPKNSCRTPISGLYFQISKAFGWEPGQTASTFPRMGCD